MIMITNNSLLEKINISYIYIEEPVKSTLHLDMIRELSIMLLVFDILLILFYNMIEDIAKDYVSKRFILDIILAINICFIGFIFIATFISY